MIEKKKIVDVSIVAANYNNALFLDGFINSVLCSSVYPIELIIVDDGSTDDSIRIIQQYSLIPFLRLIVLKKNIGFADALNIGIMEAKGKYIMRVDPDDLLIPDRIYKQYCYLESHSKVDVIGCNIIYVTSDVHVLFNSNVFLKHNFIMKSLKQGDIPLFNGTLMGKNEIFKKFPFDPKYTDALDYEFLAHIAYENCILVNLSDYLSFYRIHQQNQSQKDLWKKYKTIASIRLKYFQLRTPWIIIYRNYLHTRLFREYLQSKNHLRFFWLFLAILLRPVKFYRRIKIPINY